MKLNKKTKISIFFIIIVIVICILISNTLKSIKNMTIDSNNIETNTNEENNSLLESEEEEEENTDQETSKTLQNVTDTHQYFILKQCMSLYYNSKKIKSNLNIIDEEAIKFLNITEENAKNLIGNIEKPLFVIDEIYSQKIDLNKRAYIIYHRVENGDATYKNSAIIIKIDSKKHIFTIYPYEYLAKNNMLNLKEKDVLILSENIENRAVNYYSDMNLNDEDIIKELYERFKFDLIKDTENLFKTLDETYKKAKFENYNDLKNYIQNRSEEFTNDKIESYSSKKYTNSTEYLVKGENRDYIFRVKNIMDYTYMLDTYTIRNTILYKAL